MKKRDLLELASLTTNILIIMQNKELVKKVLHMVAGAASVSRQKLESLVEEVVEKAEMTEEEGKKLLHEIAERSREAKEEFEERVESISKKVLDRMNIVTKDDLRVMEERLARLQAMEERLSQLEKKQSTPVQ